MPAHEKRLRRNIMRDELLDRELDFLPNTIVRDDVREVARRYGPRRRRSALWRAALGLTDFVLRYSSPFMGMIVGAEIAITRALYPILGEQKEFGDSLRLILGDSLSQRVEDMSKALEVAGTLMKATPDIVAAALYGALAGIAAYVVLKRALILAVAFMRRLKLNRKIAEVVG
jgi:hypothetical protein